MSSQLFTNSKGDNHCYPYLNKSYVDESLMDFANDIGRVPNYIVGDNFKENHYVTGKPLYKKLRLYSH